VSAPRPFSPRCRPTRASRSRSATTAAPSPLRRRRLRAQAERPAPGALRLHAHRGRGHTDRFILNRARIALSGFAWKNTQFKVEESLSDQGNTRLRDFYLNQVFLDGAVQLRAGQFTRPFNRQEIVSDFATEFVEKSNTNTWVGVQGGRDVGVALTNGYEKSPDGLE
jgi:hypothetical protein